MNREMILSNLTHQFFTYDSASNFRNANIGENPVGQIQFHEMPIELFETKSTQDETFAKLPTDDELWALISAS